MRHLTIALLRDAARGIALDSEDGFPLEVGLYENQEFRQ